jgi:hypothetical protein
MAQLTYQFNQMVNDVHGASYRVVGRTDNENVIHVHPTKGTQGGMNYCVKHQIAYGHKENCELCRLQVVAEPIG